MRPNHGARKKYFQNDIKTLLGRDFDVVKIMKFPKETEMFESQMTLELGKLTNN